MRHTPQSIVACTAHCDGRRCSHITECAVCGFDQVLPGFDCLACETVGHLFPADLARFDVAKFAAAVAVARDAALAERLEA